MFSNHTTRVCKTYSIKPYINNNKTRTLHYKMLLRSTRLTFKQPSTLNQLFYVFDFVFHYFVIRAYFISTQLDAQALGLTQITTLPHQAVSTLCFTDTELLFSVLLTSHTVQMPAVTSTLGFQHLRPSVCGLLKTVSLRRNTTLVTSTWFLLSTLKRRIQSLKGALSAAREQGWWAVVFVGNVVVGQRRRGAIVRRRFERCSKRRPADRLRANPRSRATQRPTVRSCCSPRTAPG